MTASLFSKNQLSTVSDTELLDLINRGSKPALTELYDRYWELIFFYVNRVLKDIDGASDVVQETFIALWQKQGELSGVHSLKAYLLGIARYKALRCITLSASEERYRSSLLTFFNDYQESSEITFIASEMESFLDSHIQCLPERMREVFLLSRREQLSYAEIAQRLNISDKTVKKQINNALKYLRSVLDEKHMWTTILLCATVFK
ncbi:RNA polymerase sigma factor [Telluribacter sp. SYSU D00476]|uniref:RNA polymerase sigma factor n=1 Tax=Telluribacter sp. SYSU D00476 TaxID=2811430 RepID=UPI001FF431B9|nr:RNA polymerase sigma-70 factor [Telluribacter sp. SYSU D00476]